MDPFGRGFADEFLTPSSEIVLILDETYLDVSTWSILGSGLYKAFAI